MKLASYTAFGLWALLLAGVTGAVARAAPFGTAPGVGLGPWTPDLALVLLLAMSSRLERSDARIAAALVATVRAALGVDSPFALLAGLWFAVEAIGYARTQLRVEGRLLHALLVAAVSGMLTAWLHAAAVLRAPTPIAAERGVLDDALAAAAATGLVAYLVGRLPSRLPGLRGLWHKGESWERVGHVRS
ncbi:hypothetical protein Pla163_30940 [Planctomycetes bacterium Pla163]|jgi:hypothetical protein|uniref:Uncharacterized protein n=1 Tax=Rohdeia mirabilis TaxID=2528008 RepID=A0A518D395_9BACT|nr:hypothetical protein Pla163_30940 [Planctomycetes bacterium Pla163]